MTCMVSSRKLWHNRQGYFRDGFHVYANDDDLAKGYHSHSQQNRDYQWQGYEELTVLPASLFPGFASQKRFSAANRNHIRSKGIRGRIWRATFQQLELPPDSSFDAIRPARINLKHSSNSKTTRQVCPRTSIFASLLQEIRKGTAGPPTPSLGLTVPGAGGKPIPIEKAIADARRSYNTRLADFLTKKLNVLSMSIQYRQVDEAMRRRFEKS